MRDIFIIAAFPILLYYILKRPYIGVTLWIWSALFFPNGWVYGFANNLRFNFLIALATIISYFFNEKGRKYQISLLTVLVLIFFIWTTISSILTISIKEVVWFEWNIFLKIIVFYFFCTLILKEIHDINVFIWGIILSAGYFGCVEAIKYIVSLGGHVLEGIPGSRLSDRNELALALNMILPLQAYTITCTKNKWIRVALICSIVLTTIAIIGTYSRGGLLGLIVVGFYFFLQSKKKILVLFSIFFISLVATQFTSDKWSSRMDTIQTMDEDASFMGRVMAWKQATLMAVDNPIFGAGFKAGQNQFLWKLYEPEFYKLNFIVDTSDIHIETAKAAHSIYFQVLGDHGIVGLIFFLLIIYSCYRKLNWITSNSIDRNTENLARMLKVSLIAYCAGGAALSLPYFDLSFALFAMTHCLGEITKNSKIQYESTIQQP